MEAHLKVIGTSLTLLAFLHAGFPRYFNWAAEFKPLSLINRQMMYVHTLFIALLVLLTGLLCLNFAPELVQTHLGRVVCLGMGIFWLMRLVVQFVGYSTLLWRGKAFETTIHVLFSLFWLYLTIIFLLVYWQ